MSALTRSFSLVSAPHSAGARASLDTRYRGEGALLGVTGLQLPHLGDGCLPYIVQGSGLKRVDLTPKHRVVSR